MILAGAIEWVRMSAVYWDGKGLAGVCGTECRILFWTREFWIHIRSPSKNVWQAVTYEDTGLEVKEEVRARDTHLGNICIKIFRTAGLDEIIRGECTAKEEDIEYTFFIKTKVSVHSKREKCCWVLKVKLEKCVQYIQANG